MSFSNFVSLVNRFKKSAVANQPTGNSVTNVYPKAFIQFAGDDVDHNIRALDGSGTFHVMYIIGISNPFSGNSVLKECYKISWWKDITFVVSVNSKE